MSSDIIHQYSGLTETQLRQLFGAHVKLEETNSYVINITL